VGQLDGLGLERAVLGYESYRQEADSLRRAINLNDTYTFCFWGPSRCVDLSRWHFNFGTIIPMDQFFQESPLHFVLYELDEGPQESKEHNNGTGGRHLESRKWYYLDAMGWSTKVDCSHLAQKYTFLDAPDGIEEEMAETDNGCTGDCKLVKVSDAQARKGTIKGSGYSLVKINQNVVCPLLSARLIHLIVLLLLLWRLAQPEVHGVTVIQRWLD